LILSKKKSAFIFVAIARSGKSPRCKSRLITSPNTLYSNGCNS